MRYKHWPSRVRRDQGNLTKVVAYQIIEGQFFFASTKEIDIMLIDECLDCLFPDRHEWTYQGKERGWNQLLRRLENEEAIQETKSRKNAPFRRYQRPYPVVALLILLLMLLSGTVAYALGFDFIEYVVHWTEEILNITVTVDYPETGMDAQEVQDTSSHGIARDLEGALNELGMHPHLPQWIPDGFRLVETSQYSIEPNIKVLDAFYSNEDESEFFVTIYAFDGTITYSKNTEKNNDENSYVYRTQQCDYYFVRNMDRYTVSWLESNCWIKIDGTLSDDLLLQMIHSL